MHCPVQTGLLALAARSSSVGIVAAMHFKLPKFPALMRMFARASVQGFYPVKVDSFLTEVAAEDFEVFLGKPASGFSC